MLLASWRVPAGGSGRLPAGLRERFEEEDTATCSIAIDLLRSLRWFLAANAKSRHPRRVFMKSLPIPVSQEAGRKSLTLKESYAWCEELTRRSRSNFRWSFYTLDADRRRAMMALYGFMRLTDDLGDDESIPSAERAVQLGEWRKTLANALASTSADNDSSHPLMPALRDTITRFEIPPQYLYDVIAGVEMDLHPVGVKTLTELETYSYHVAGAVGLCCIHIWGFRGEEAIPPALACGRALQYTNILRDVGGDLELGRIYLPEELLEANDYSVEQLKSRVYSPQFVAVMEQMSRIARDNYAESEQLFPLLDPAGRPILRAITDTYLSLLERIERARFRVFDRRIRVPAWRKLWLVGRSLLTSKPVARRMPRNSNR
jgi:phytoene synthase